MRFMQVLNTSLMAYAPRALRGITNMHKQTVKRNILIKWCERSTFLSLRFLEPKNLAISPPEISGGFYSATLARLKNLRRNRCHLEPWKFRSERYVPLKLQIFKVCTPGPHSRVPQEAGGLSLFIIILLIIFY